MKTETEGTTGASETQAVVTEPTPRTPRPRTRGGKGTITRNVGIPKEPVANGRKTRAKRSTTVKTVRRPYTRRTPVAVGGTTAGNQGALLQQMLTANGFTLDSAKLVVTEGRKSMTLPLGLFTGK